MRYAIANAPYVKLNVKPTMVMSNYRRLKIAGGTYFFTQTTYHQHHTWLCSEVARTALRNAINHVRERYPFTIDALVLLPNHIHCLWTLPPNDDDYATRWRLLKTYVTKECANQLNLSEPLTISRQKRGEQNLWQRRFWEHLIRDDHDFTKHFDYIHWNPVKHGYVQQIRDWPYSTFHRYVKMGFYTIDWCGMTNL